MNTRALARLTCAAFVCIPQLVQAADGPTVNGTLAVVLDYSAAPLCPSADDFKVVVIGQLGYDPFREDASNHVRVRLSPRGRTMEGWVEWRDASGDWTGERTFPSRSNDCRELVRAVAFALALQIQLLAIAKTPVDANLGAQDEANGPAGVQPPPDRPPDPPHPTPSSEPSNVSGMVSVAELPASGPRPAFTISAGAEVAFGLSARAVPLGRLSGSMAWTHLSLELAAEVGLSSTIRRADGAGFSQQPLLAGAAGCGHTERLSACIVAKAGQIRIVGQAIDVPASPSGAILVTGLRLAFVQPLGRHVYLAAYAEGLLFLTRWTVTLDGLPVWTAPRFGEIVGLDVGLRFR